MTRRIKPAPRPRYQQTYPDHLATAEDLRALGLRPAPNEPAAILEYAFKDRSGICALYARDEAVPITAPREPA
ncbi:hypothetical protein E7T09_16195 [Deinococcus sp. KSM4-11]|uniref:hypothetical protein n=1 Tax=Deinococcus sp. KSM4-11 TaxID=2568654 RepID=UPI0010A40730|nr:hypothetical protein [Deinococcus sp. KSM4-11]THF85497.1 hypothetical protein E7T09_16195 [Deinococcus sp. KSM4-11]